MKIAIASGKGGTGKTTLAVNLAYFLGKQNKNVVYCDCDVEEPNGHLFLKPEIEGTQSASIMVPSIDESKCTACGRCVSLCQYNALVRLGKSVMVFAELCHGCGGCSLFCPKNAIKEHPRNIGVVQSGKSGELNFVNGRLNIGEAFSPPLIRKVIDQGVENAINIIDAPPGTSCPVIAAIRSAQYVVLVTEPTPFGLNDLGLALDMVTELKIPHGVVINRAEISNTDAEKFCQKRQTTVIGCILDDRRIAESYSRGQMIIDDVPEISKCFWELWESIRKYVKV